jgi:hypothetical protein
MFFVIKLPTYFSAMSVFSPMLAKNGSYYYISSDYYYKTLPLFTITSCIGNIGSA